MNQRLRQEVRSKIEEIADFRNKLDLKKQGISFIEEGLRERLHVKDREMAEQLDKIEVILAQLLCHNVYLISGIASTKK